MASVKFWVRLTVGLLFATLSTIWYRVSRMLCGEWNRVEASMTAADQIIPGAGFDETKSAQMAAYLAQQSKDPVDKLKLIKLIYLTEREFLARHLLPMTLDEFYSMKNGPVASSALDGLNGRLNKAFWEKWIKNKSNKISAVKVRSRDEFDDLSDADIEVLNAVWAEFGSYTTSQIWQHVHTKCPEYQAVEQGRLPISYNDLLTALQKQNVKELEENIKMLRREAAFM